MRDAQRSESDSGSKTWEQNSIKSQITKSDNIKIVKMSIYSRSFIVNASAYQKYSYVNWSWSLVVRIHRYEKKFNFLLSSNYKFHFNWIETTTTLFVFWLHLHVPKTRFM